MDQNFNNQPNEEQSPAASQDTAWQQNNTTEAQQFPYTPQNDPFYPHNNYTKPTKSEPNGYAIASLILGIVSLILCCCSCISIVTSVLAIIFAILSRQGQPMPGNALGGMICGIVSLAATLLFTGFFILSIAETNYEDMDDFFNDFTQDEEFNKENYGYNEDYYIYE